MFRAMFRSLLCKKGGCCLWLFLKRRQPLYADDDDELLCDQEVDIGMSQVCGVSVPEMAPICALPEVYENQRMFSCGLDAQKQSDGDSSDVLVAEIERLAAEEKSTSRLRACKILCAIYGRSTPSVKDHLGEIYIRLCEDKDMLVRRLTLSMLTEFAREADVKFFASKVVPLLEKLLDDKVGLRLEAAQILINLFRSQQLSQVVYRHLLPVFYKYAEDGYWQVRFIIANSINDVHKSVKSSPMALIAGYLNDPEERVRKVARQQLHAFINYR